MPFQLFKLQRTFGGDKRFELDSRFLESEEEDEDGHDAHTQSDKVDEEESSSKYNNKDVTKEVEDGISEDLKQEKEMALKVLSNLLGGDFRAEFNQGGQETEPEFRYVCILLKSLLCTGPVETFGDGNGLDCCTSVSTEFSQVACRLSCKILHSCFLLVFLRVSSSSCTHITKCKCWNPRGRYHKLPFPTISKLIGLLGLIRFLRNAVG